MNFPIEIIENILIRCDGQTLLNARKVNDDWKAIVDKYTHKTRIWEWCCREEIPKNELVEYLESYKDCVSEKWLKLYLSWRSWENINRVVVDIIASPVEIPKISCIAVTNDFIAVGSHDGRIRIYNTQWRMLYCDRLLAVKINSLTFVESGYTDSGLDICLIISFHKGLHIFIFDGLLRTVSPIQDVKSHSVHKNYICYEQYGGRVIILKLNNLYNRRELEEVWFSRIYSPTNLTQIKMWEGVCTFLINNDVKTINYESSEITPMHAPKKKTKIKFNFPLMDSQSTQILRDDVIVSLCKDDEDVKCDFIEFFILGENDNYSKKMFNTWEIFKSYITCIYLYGNTLVLGMDVGNVYFYHVSCWKNLDIRKYSHKVIVGKHPINCIAVKETSSERRFYVASKVGIHEITGFVPNIY